MGKGLEQTLLQGGHTEGPEAYEKMLNITNYQRCMEHPLAELPCEGWESSLWPVKDEQGSRQRVYASSCFWSH